VRGGADLRRGHLEPEHDRPPATRLVRDWNVFHDPFTFAAFVIFYLTANGECKRAPFDLAEAKATPWPGSTAEYSGSAGRSFSWRNTAACSSVSGLAALLFLGGWHTGFLPFERARRPSRLLVGQSLDLVVFGGQVLACSCS